MKFKDWQGNRFTHRVSVIPKESEHTSVENLALHVVFQSIVLWRSPQWIVDHMTGWNFHWPHWRYVALVVAALGRSGGDWRAPQRDENLSIYRSKFKETHADYRGNRYRPCFAKTSSNGAALLSTVRIIKTTESCFEGSLDPAEMTWRENKGNKFLVSTATILPPHAYQSLALIQLEYK